MIWEWMNRKRDVRRAATKIEVGGVGWENMEIDLVRVCESAKWEWV